MVRCEISRCCSKEAQPNDCNISVTLDVSPKFPDTNLAALRCMYCFNQVDVLFLCICIDQW